MRPGLLGAVAVIFLTTAGWALAREPARPHAAGEDAAVRRQAALLAALWPGRVAALTGDAARGADWAGADRLFMWMRALARDAGLPGASPASLSPPRPAPSVASPPELEDAPEEFAPPGGGLSWPATGRVAAAFAPAGNPPRQGLVLAVAEDTPVTAAAAGRVVFTGAFMGLGRVLILSHGGRRHTVYACLGRLDAAEGDTLARGDVLGQAGYCGPIRKPGVYFELRFREKALNPAEWLAVRR